jgi:hypothetical protein
MVAGNIARRFSRKRLVIFIAIFLIFPPTYFFEYSALLREIQAITEKICYSF